MGIKIRDIANEIRDLYIPVSDDDLPYIGLEHIEQESLQISSIGSSREVKSQKFRFQTGDILFGTLRPYFRKVVIAPCNGVCSTDICVMRPENASYRDFVLYAIAHPKFIKYATVTSQGARPRTKWKIFSDYEFLELFPAQCRTIGKILSAYDNLIENNRRRIQLLEQAARLLYKEWFVHFRFPGHEHTTITDGVPEGWESRTVREQVTLVRGKSYRSSELVETGGKAFINLKCIARHGGFRLDGLKRFSGSHKDNQIAFPGDIIIALTDMTRERHVVAHPARIPAAIGKEAVFSMDTVKAVPSESIDKTWFYYFLRYSDFSKEVRECATGTNVLHLKPKEIEAYEFHLPPQVLQREFGSSVQSILSQQDNFLIQNGKLAEIRDLVLPKLMSGTLSV